MCSIGLVKQAIQQNVSLALSKAIRGTFREKLSHELGFESLERRSWYQPEWPYSAKRAQITRNDDALPYFKAEHNYFKNSCFPSAWTNGIRT